MRFTVMARSALPLPYPLRRAQDRLRARIAGRVRGFFAEQGEGRPSYATGPGFYPPGSAIRAVHADVTSMMVGGTAALLMQMLHPHALAGVLGHSAFRSDMQGRLRRTARFIAVTTYGSREDAEAAIARVNAIHARVGGIAADGAPYSARDPHLLAWIHVAEVTSFLAAYRRYARPEMSQEDRDSYFAETALVARKLGADPVPDSEDEAQALLRRYRPELRATAETRGTARLVLKAQGASVHPAAGLLSAAAVDLLPGWARGMLHLRTRTISALPLRAATFTGAATLRWAFGQR